MKPVITLVGRPNVGKSTLFNRLTRSRDALVADFAGTTRDRHYGEGRAGSRPYWIVDTGGFEPAARRGIIRQMAQQTRQAVDESDCILFIVDARQGLTPQDEWIAAWLRKTGRPLCVILNKAEGNAAAYVLAADFYALGLGELHPISAAHGNGVSAMIEAALEAACQGREAQTDTEEEGEDRQGRGIRIAVAGRPNVGKSTLINALLGEERVIASDAPGTTRDSIAIDFQWQGRDYQLIDTAGVRRRARVSEAIEKFSVIKTMQSIAAAHVVVLLLDARQEISEQDAHLAGFVVEQGRALVIGVNKWDGLDSYQRERAKVALRRKLPFLDFAEFHFISALRKTGLEPLMRSVDAAYQAGMCKLPTPKLTLALRAAAGFQPPRRSGLIRPKLRYAHQGGHNPPAIVIHGNALDALTPAYQRYLEKRFRAAFPLVGTPLRLILRTGKNPYTE
ncbi:GTP-binding protein EngA [Candidatus Glomeribacter gigasporarum BEG34]|uniref:GTPase Der n=1 Tax=Candidatus Glomeribacter gigasporarum BEG34 TaxID=1070319 RepID=G2JA94_9BURK|nr:ribosome biogenesis GTPase Der [Candidatus Glomeribacter gigasporarum]CCD29695.1 GTP-binding protein EngA [Candidatus Glomeribacter gigasporarum BEG34]